MEQKFETILISKEDGVATITFNRPEKKNAMSPRMHRDMDQALTLLARDKECVVLVLTGAGDSWCAGEDLEEYFHNLIDKPLDRSDASAWSKWRGEKLRLFPKPTIASINGWCIGGAFTALASCDIAIAAEEARFVLSEINFGHFPGGEVTKAISEILAPRDVLYLSMTGEIIDGKQAEKIRLVTRAVPLAKLKEETRRVAEILKSKEPLALRTTKELYHLSGQLGREEARSLSSLFGRDLNLIQGSRADMAKEGIRQFKERKYKPALGSYDWKTGKKGS